MYNKKAFFYRFTGGRFFFLLYYVILDSAPLCIRPLWSYSDEIYVITIKMITLYEAIGEKKTV